MRPYQFWDRPRIMAAIDHATTTLAGLAQSASYQGGASVMMQQKRDIMITLRDLFKELGLKDGKDYLSGASIRHIDVDLHSGYGVGGLDRNHGPFSLR